MEESVFTEAPHMKSFRDFCWSEYEEIKDDGAYYDIYTEEVGDKTVYILETELRDEDGDVWLHYRHHHREDGEFVLMVEDTGGRA